MSEDSELQRTFVRASDAVLLAWRQLSESPQVIGNRSEALQRLNAVFAELGAIEDLMRDDGAFASMTRPEAEAAPLIANPSLMSDHPKSYR